MESLYKDGIGNGKEGLIHQGCILYKKDESIDEDGEEFEEL
ncbi:hypothetical protein [Mycoplasma suis]|nr:hypothetical protein [Mycoplasma suis]